MTLLLAFFCVPLALINTVFLVEVFAGLRQGHRTAARTGTDVRSVVVIPAHDEEKVIAATLTRLKDLGARHHLLVVADNCSDRTADICRDMGVEVLERTDPDRRGKGFALDHAARALRGRGFDVVTIVDADCRIDGDSLDRLVREAAAGRPAQTVNLLMADLTKPPMVQVSTFAFLVKNLVRQRGLERLCGRVHLTGTGMAFPAHLFLEAPLATDDIVEDLGLGLELAAQGHPPTLVTDAFVWSEGASSEGTLLQRRRWEGGYLRTATRIGPSLLWKGIRAMDIRTLCSGLDLLVPPLTLLFLLNFALLILGAGFSALTGAAWWPVQLLATATLLAILAIAAVWLRLGRAYLSGRALLMLPLYMAWKVPLYLRLVRGEPSAWLRTGR